ncbi:methionine ABC transporter ATP-binding protein [Sporosalibacterium faouarense]|uniref:methionine ABC transporter ATP-binding protein n=1 Tax=Sporosalibacterium faouarense TaxID=516123 RepID=UPI00192B190E|nr:methionine ABC transporter ATP-binding protein [Sporosalibacterium faouarense]
MIKIENLSKVYSKEDNKVVALDNINLFIEQGSIFGIIGLSGAGKSSLIRCINRIEEPTTGNILISNVNVSNLSTKRLRNLRKNIGMIFQGFNLLSSKTVFDNIAFPLKLSKVPKTEISKRVNELLELVDLTDKANSYPSQLSGGQKQRVGIARALVSNPNVLLCDEATSALDPKTTKQILDLLKRINKTFGITIILITHEMDVVKEICTHVAILENGQILEAGNTIDVFSTPRQKATQDFVDQLRVLPTSLDKDRIFSLSFTHNSAGKPLISKIIREFEVDINILSGKIEWIQDKPIGKLIVQIKTDMSTLHLIQTFLKENNVKMEVLNYE